jgi:hypothetical protein
MSKSDLQADYNDMEPDGVDDRLRSNGRPGQWLEKGKEFLLSVSRLVGRSVGHLGATGCDGLIH